jgi:hypothetical protein
MALVRTDYGLIYNTDGSLCATLLPEGGVAVTEGTTNGIQNGNFAIGDFTGWAEWNPENGTRSIVSHGGIKYAKIESLGSGSFGIQSTKNISVQPGDKVTVSFRVRGEKPNYAFLMLSITPNVRIDSLIKYTDLPNGESIGEYTWTADRAADVGFLFAYAAGTPKSGEFTHAQLEKKPYRTPFVDGTRPAGTLSYHDLAKHFNQREFTFACWWRPYLELGTPGARIFHVDESPATGRRIALQRINTLQNLNLFLPNAAGNDNQIFTFIPSAAYAANTWHFVAVVVDVENMTARIHLNDEYEEFTLLETPATLDLKRFFLGCYGTTNQLNGELKDVLIRPYAVSPETIATWHSLDAPFFDPGEQIDAAAKTIHMYQSDITGHGHTVRDQYGNKAVFSGVDPDTGDRGYKVYDTNGSDEVTFLGVRADGRRGLMLKEGDTTWLDPGGISGSKVKSLPWTSLDSVTQLLFAGLFEGNFIVADENGKYGFNFGEGASQIKSYVLKATEDTYVNSLEYTAYDQVYSWRDVNYGTEAGLRIANNAEHSYGIGHTNYHKHAYVKFSGLSSIPSSEEIVDAELRLYFTNLSATRFILGVPAATWPETTITWNNQPGTIPHVTMAFDAKLGTTIIKKAPFIDLIDLLDVIRANGWESRGFRIWAFDESRDESVLYSREGHSTLCPTLVVYTRESQSPVPGLNLHVPGGPAFLNRKIFDVPGKTLTLDTNRNDITLYAYENEDGEAVIDFAHGGRAFKADSYVILGSAKTSNNAIIETSKKRNSGRKEGPRGMGNDVYSFGYTPDDGGVISISTQTRTPFKEHGLGGSKYHVILEIRPSGGTWQKFYPTIDASGSRGITVEIDSSKIQFIAGSDSVYRYLTSDGTMINSTSAQIRGIIIRLD